MIRGSSRFSVLLGATANLAAIGGALALNHKTAPPALIGTFGGSPEQCRSFNRKADDMHVVAADRYTFCGGSSCETRITGSTKTANGYRLRLISTFSGASWSVEFREVSPDVLEIRTDADPRVETVVRCTSKDIEAGIGRSAGADGLTQSRSAAFSAYYAEAVPTHCPAFRVDAIAVRNLVTIAVEGWEAHLRRHNLVPLSPGATFRQRVERDVASERQSATTAARQDFEELPSFCEAAERAFGPGGRVVPDLLADPRKKAAAPTPSNRRAG